MTKFSLWLIPSGDVYRSLFEIISGLGRKFSTPIFEPHVTLIGDVDGTEEEIITKTGTLSRIIRPYRITLTSMDYSDNYFMSLFLRVIETEEIVDVNSKAREVFGRQLDPPYIPHLSLMYGNLDVGTKEKIIKELGRIDLNFEAQSISIFSVEGKVENWHKVRDFAL